MVYRMKNVHCIMLKFYLYVVWFCDQTIYNRFGCACGTHTHNILLCRINNKIVYTKCLFLFINMAIMMIEENLSFLTEENENCITFLCIIWSDDISTG